MSDFKLVSNTDIKRYEKRTIYDREQFLDIQATITNRSHFDIKITGSQNTNIKTDMSYGCLQALVADLTSLLEESTKGRG